MDKAFWLCRVYVLFCKRTSLADRSCFSNLARLHLVTQLGFRLFARIFRNILIVVI